MKLLEAAAIRRDAVLALDAMNAASAGFNGGQAYRTVRAALEKRAKYYGGKQ